MRLVKCPPSSIRTLDANFSAFTTETDNSYFFVFLQANSTQNLGTQYTPQLGNSGLNGLLRVDYRRIGPTWCEPFNVTRREPVDLFDIRIGIEGDTWSLTAWSKNLFNEE